MRLENTFTIEAPIEKAWEALNTPQTVAPCFPGAVLGTYEGDSFTGTVKVKLGPISMTYKGKGTYRERDDAAHRVVIKAGGRDSRGNGTANATVTAAMVADGPNRTSVTMVTDMTITGRPAQFGRGVISDVADRIIGQFAACVADKLAPQVAAPSSVGRSPAVEAAAAAGSNGSVSSGSVVTVIATGPAPSSPPSSVGIDTPKPVAQPAGPMRGEIDAIDLLDTAGVPVLKRLAPALGGALLLALLVVFRRRSR